MFHICAVPALKDNYIWVIHNNTDAIVIDAGDDKPVMDYLNVHQLTLNTILITHHDRAQPVTHKDHIGGVAKLLAHYPNAKLIAHHAHDMGGQWVDEGDTFKVLGLTFKIWRTAGHTATHLSYLVDIDGKTHVFCGDTLFSGGCGRVFSGTMDELYDSLMRFDALPSDVLFYPAHEYTLSNLKFGEFIEPHNTAIKKAIAHAIDCQHRGVPTLPVSLKHERAVNVFLHVDDIHVKDRLTALGKLDKQADARQVFKALRLLKNNPPPVI